MARPSAALRTMASVSSMYLSPSQKDGSGSRLPERTAAMKSASTVHARASSSDTGTSCSAASCALPAMILPAPPEA